MSRVPTSILPSAFYRALTIGGIVLFTVGLIFATMGPAAYQEAYSEEIPVTKKLAGSSDYLVDAEGFRYFCLNLSSGASVSGSVKVTSNGQINFYVMSRQHYEAWRVEERLSGIIIQKMVQSYDFSLTPPNDGAYYFVLDNSDSPVPKQVTVSEINATLKHALTKYRTVYDYTIPTLSFSSLIIGTISILVGLIKKPRPPPKELKKLPISLIGYIRLLLPYLFLLVEAVNGFFGSLIVINWLKIEFYQYYSPRTIQLIIFSPAIDWWIWIGSLIFTFTVSYILMKALGGTISRPLILSHLTLPASFIFYLTPLQNLATPLLLLGSFSAICVSIIQARKLLQMSMVKALIVFLTGLFGVVIPIELASLVIWIRNSFDPRYPFDIDPRWRIPWIEVQMFNVAYPLASWLLLMFVISWTWLPALRMVLQNSWGKGTNVSTLHVAPLPIWQGFSISAILFSIICGVYLTYAPYIANNRGVRGVDTLWYYQTFDQIKNIDDLKKMLLHDPRGFYFSLLYAVRLITSQPALTVVQWTPALLAILATISTYYFVKVGTKNQYFASLSSIIAAFSFYTTVGMFAGIFGDWLAISMIMLTLTLFLKALEKRSKLYLLFSGVASLSVFFIHLWTWGVVIGIFVFYFIMSLARLGVKDPNAKREMAFALSVPLLNLSPALIVIIFPQFTQYLGLLTLSSVSTVTNILIEYVSFSHISELLPNLSYTLRVYVGGSYANPLIFTLSIIGLAAIGDYKKNFNRILAAWVLVEAIVLSFYGNLPTVWRFLYVLPFPVTTAIGISFITEKLGQRILSSPSIEGSDKICFFTFQAFLIVVIILSLFNYATRCIVLIY